MNYMPVAVNSISVALGSKLVPPTQESEIIRKLFAGICTVEKKGFGTVYVGWATRRFRKQ